MIVSTEKLTHSEKTDCPQSGQGCWNGKRGVAERCFAFLNRKKAWLRLPGQGREAAGNPNRGNLTYGQALQQAVVSNPNSPAVWLQAIAQAGWNTSSTYGSHIVNNINIGPLISCLSHYGYI